MTHDLARLLLFDNSVSSNEITGSFLLQNVEGDLEFLRDQCKSLVIFLGSHYFARNIITTMVKIMTHDLNRLSLFDIIDFRLDFRSVQQTDQTIYPISCCKLSLIQVRSTRLSLMVAATTGTRTT